MLKAERTDHEPTPTELAEAQDDLGYSPAGYGGPFRISTTVDAGVFTTTWECFGSCD